MLRRWSTVQFSLFVLVFLSAPAARAATTELDADTIKAALRTTTIEEDGFVDRALKMVGEGKLSMALVQSTFDWARKQPQHRFQHFKRGLILRVSDPAVRAELQTGQTPPVPPPPNLAAILVSGVRRLFSSLSSLHTLLK